MSGPKTNGGWRSVGRLPFGPLPFSRYGSWFSVSACPDGSIALRSLHGGDMAPSVLYTLSFEGHAIKDFDVDMSESELVFTLRGSGKGKLCLVCGGSSTLLLRASGLCARLAAPYARYNSLVPLGSGSWEHQLYNMNIKVGITGGQGLSAEGEWQVSESRGIALRLNGAAETAECTLKLYPCVPEAGRCTYEKARAGSAAHFARWSAGLAPGSPAPHAGVARYVLWANFVAAEGRLVCSAMYMNKLSMNNIWSWDNCFCAAALARAHPRQAMQQLLLPFCHQHASGALPDYVNDVFASYSCLKPPVYGWAVNVLRRQSVWFRQAQQSSLLYSKLAGLTHFWLSHRMNAELGLPYYMHGNDSGWDNASVFHAGVPLCSPDLPAFLIVQMDTLAALAKELGRPAAAAGWARRANHMLAALMRHLWDGDGFFSMGALTRKRDPQAHSLLNLLPLVLGSRLAPHVREKLVARLEHGFEQEYGLATERPNSKYYQKGGYWLGPVWAPASFLFIDALHRCGHSQMARRLGQKFLRLPAKGLMAENFDPFTGEGYDDNSFAWTAALYIYLCQ